MTEPAPPRGPEGSFARLVGAVRSVLVAGDRPVRLAVACLVAGGHLLVEDLPGVGKTTLVKALAASLGLGHRRVQCTADLVPADITGAMVLDHPAGGGPAVPTFRPGPVFTNVLMADELNRASPRAQSALLEAMEEHQVTVDGQSRPLPRPFLVVATQNPYDAAGTSPLPHGQRDRFLVRLSLGYPSRAEEDALLARSGGGTVAAPRDPLGPAGGASRLEPAVTRAELDELSSAAAGAHVSAAVRAYVLDLVGASRNHPSVRVGASPRAALGVVAVARAMAVAAGRRFVTPGDVQAVAGPTLAHRLLLQPGASTTGIDPDTVVAEVLDAAAVPAPVPEDSPVPSPARAAPTPAQAAAPAGRTDT